MSKLQKVYIPTNKKKPRFLAVLQDDNVRYKDTKVNLEEKEGYFFTEEELKPLTDISDEGYDPYDTAHHLVIQRWLKTIEEFLKK